MGRKIRIPARLPLVSLLFLAIAPAVGAEDVPIGILSDWKYHNDAAWKLLNKGDYPRAEQRFRMAIELIRPYQKQEQRLLARSYADLARVLYHEGRYADAEPLAKWALGVRENHPRRNPDAVFQSLYTLALIHIAQDHFDQAEPLLRRALAIQETAIGPTHVQTGATLDELAGVLAQQRKFPEAERLYKRAINVYGRFDPEVNLDLAACTGRYAAMLEKMDRTNDARKSREAAQAIQKRVKDRAERSRDTSPRPGFRAFK